MSLIKKFFDFFKNRRGEAIIIFCSLLFLNLWLYAFILSQNIKNDSLKIYFLSVGQGDSELIKFPGGAKILIDAGPPNKKVLQELSKILSPFEKTIEIASISHPQLDHFGGMMDIITRYKIGAFVSSGANNSNTSFQTLKSEIKKRKIPEIILLKGDRIKYGTNVIEILNPTPKIINSAKDLNDTSIVMLLKSENLKAVFTGDIGAKTEKIITPLLASGIDILKIAHHGSKTSSNEFFLKFVKPKIGIIEVGKNSYGHPTKETLSRLKKYNTHTYRTDKFGTIELRTRNQKIQVYNIK